MQVSRQTRILQDHAALEEAYHSDKYMNYKVNLVNYEINNHSSYNLKLWERNQPAHEILFAFERGSVSITENINSTLYSPREEKLF